MTVVFIPHSVEEAFYLGMDLVVMSPRPGRIIERIACPFMRLQGERDMRAIKSRPHFMAMREQVLSLIWKMDEAHQ